MFDGHEAFRERLIQLVKDTPPGHMLTSSIAQSFQENFNRLRDNRAVRTLVAGPTDASRCAAGASLTEVDAEALLANSELADEVFGPASLLVRYRNVNELPAIAQLLPGQLTATLHATEQELANIEELLGILETRAGRLVFNQFPTGVEVGHAMVHGGPYPATTDSRSTSVGATAILRFARRVCFQNFPNAALPAALQAANPGKLRRLVDGQPEGSA
jgi:NADP-dependent aldehyde dehydrogenase